MVKNVPDQRAKKKDTLTSALHLNLGERVGREQGGSWGRQKGGERGRSQKTLKGMVPSGWWRQKFQG